MRLTMKSVGYQEANVIQKVWRQRFFLKVFRDAERARQNANSIQNEASTKINNEKIKLFEKKKKTKTEFF